MHCAAWLAFIGLCVIGNFCVILQRRLIAGGDRLAIRGTR